jgi:hypothetical protein
LGSAMAVVVTVAGMTVAVALTAVLALCWVGGVVGAVAVAVAMARARVVLMVRAMARERLRVVMRARGRPRFLGRFTSSRRLYYHHVIVDMITLQHILISLNSLPKTHSFVQKIDLPCPKTKFSCSP